MAEIELSVFGKQALKARVADEIELRRQTGALETECNEAAPVRQRRSAAVSRAREYAGAVHHHLEQFVEVEALVDAQASRAQAGEPFPERGYL